jgi:hypothetical protein
MILHATPREKIPKDRLKKYRLLNDSILVTRKRMDLAFDTPGNIRIVCDVTMSLYILALLHVTLPWWVVSPRNEHSKPLIP